MRDNRFGLSAAGTPDDAEPPSPKTLPELPKEWIRKNATAPDAEESTRKRATTTLHAFEPRQKRVTAAECSLSRFERELKSREATLERDLDERERTPTVYMQRKSSAREMLSFSNLPSIAGLLASALVAFGLFGTELYSVWLLMWNSGWGLVEHPIGMLLIVAVFVIQPFFALKCMLAVVPSWISRGVERVVAIAGPPLGFVGMFVVAYTLGPLADSVEFSMTMTEVPETPESIPKPLYVFTALVLMWSGSFSAYFWFLHFLDQLWPVTAVPRSDYMALTFRIERTEKETAELQRKIIQAQNALEDERRLEEFYVEECLSFLADAQEELRGLQSAVKLPAFPPTPSKN